MRTLFRLLGRFVSRRNSRWGGVCAGGLVLATVLMTAAMGVAWAARVKGTISVAETSRVGNRIGFARKRIVTLPPSATLSKPAVALFLAVEDGNSLPIPAPTAHQSITIEGLKFSPNIASCASDAQVSFVNADRDAVTVTVDGEAFATVEPGAQKTYVCSPGQPLRVIRVEQWPHMQALVYVGEVGVAAVPDDRGRFTFDAPQGDYELRVIGRDGIVLRQKVTVANNDLNLGQLDVGVTVIPQGE